MSQSLFMGPRPLPVRPIQGLCVFPVRDGPDLAGLITWKAKTGGRVQGGPERYMTDCYSSVLDGLDDDNIIYHWTATGREVD